MKKIIFFTIALLGTFSVQSQNVGIGTATPDASARLDVSDTQRGILIPRVALSATNIAGPVAGPATSLLVYNTATAGSAPNNVWPGYYYWDGSQWVRLLDNQSDDWRLDGNTNAALRYIGTNDNFDFPIYTNGTEKIRVMAGGNVGIGTAAPAAKLSVIGPATGTGVTIYSGGGGDVLLAAGGSLFFDNNYSYATGSYIRPVAANTQAYFTSGNERMRITPVGNIGIGTAAPDASARLDIFDANRGILIPRVALTARNVPAPIAAPATSLLVYNTATAGAFPNDVRPGYYYWNGIEWVRLYDGTRGGWDLAGNALTGAAPIPNEFIGTTNAYYFSIRTNNVERFRISETVSQILSTANGTIGAPNYSWVAEPNTGMYRAAVGAIGFTVQGTERMRITNTPQILAGGDGTAATPIWSWIADNNMGIYRIGADILGFSTNGTERMRIAANGFVGINTNPGNLFHVYSATTPANTSMAYAQNASADGVALEGHNTSTASGYNAIEGVTDYLGTVYIPAGVFGLAVNYDAGINAPTIGVRGHSNEWQGIGVRGSRFNSGGPNTGWGGLFMNDLGYTGWFGNASDKKLKKNFTSINGALSIISKLNPMSYEYDIDKYPYMGLNQGKEYGFIAQEVEEILPEIVREKVLPLEGAKEVKPNQPQEEKMINVKMMDYTRIIPILVKGMQEQQTIIQEQNQKIQLLEERIQMLENVINNR